MQLAKKVGTNPAGWPRMALPRGTDKGRRFRLGGGVAGPGFINMRLETAAKVVTSRYRRRPQLPMRSLLAEAQAQP